MWPILIQQMVEIHKQRLEICSFLFVLPRVHTEYTEEFDEIEEQRFGDSLEDELSVGVLAAERVVVDGCLWRGVELGETLLGEGYYGVFELW